MTSFQQLIEIVKKLRGPEGCPWDKEQTHQSLSIYAIEEAYELEAAIENLDDQNLKEELGDLLFQSVLHAQIASETQRFDIDDVLNSLNEKMIRRHPHVFKKEKVTGTEEVIANWEAIKAAEKGNKPPGSPMDSIPENFPALLRSQKIGKKTKKYQFDWDSALPVIHKCEEELAELKEAISQNQKSSVEEELGDLLFTLAQLARHLDLDAEKTLRQANRKFIRRFDAMLAINKDLPSLSPVEKESLWQNVKEKEKSSKKN